MKKEEVEKLVAKLTPELIEKVDQDLRRCLKEIGETKAQLSNHLKDLQTEAFRFKISGNVSFILSLLIIPSSNEEWFRWIPWGIFIILGLVDIFQGLLSLKRARDVLRTLSEILELEISLAKSLEKKDAA